MSVEPKMYINKLLQRIPNSSQKSEDVKHFIYVQSKWQEQEIYFTFLVASTKKCYKARITIADFKLAAAELDRNYQEFYDECKKALTVNISLPGFDYEIDEEEMVFRLIKCEGFEYVFLELKLRDVASEASSSTLCDMLDTAIELIINQKNDEPIPSCNDIVEKYQDYMERSKLMENRILQKCILIVNSKKEKINELEKQLEEERRLRQRRSLSSDDDADGQMEQDTDLEDIQEDANDDTIYMVETQAMTPPRTQIESPSSRKRRIADDTDEQEGLNDN